MEISKKVISESTIFSMVSAIVVVLKPWDPPSCSYIHEKNHKNNHDFMNIEDLDKTNLSVAFH